MSTPSLQRWLGAAVVEVVRVAERVGLLDALDQPATIADLARRLDLPERPLALVLPVLVALGYAEQRDDEFQRRSDPDDMHEPWPQLDAFVRSASVAEVIDRPEWRRAYYTRTVTALGRAFAGDARELAARLPSARRIADVGAGSAIWSLAMAARHPDTEIIAIDQPEVLPLAHEMATRLALGDRVTDLPGDYFTTRPDRAVDRIILANVLHLETRDDAARLVRWHAATLAPAGELVIVDCIGGNDFVRQLLCAGYALHLGMRTARGAAHSLAEHVSWCADAGLREHTLLPLGSHAMTAMVFRRS